MKSFMLVFCGFIILMVSNQLFSETIILQPGEEGQFSIIWNGTDDNGNSVSSGLYFYQLKNRKIHKNKTNAVN